MSVTGHKSVNSLAMYQCVKGDEKMMMGMSLAYNLFFPREVYDKINAVPVRDIHQVDVPAIQTPLQPVLLQQAAIAPPEMQVNAVVPVPSKEQKNQQEENFDLLDFINEASDEEILMAATQMEKQYQQPHQISTTTTTTVVKKSPKKTMPVPIFTNCKIGAINIHIHKN